MEAGASSRRRARIPLPGEELALVVVAILILVLPGLAQDNRLAATVLVSKDVEPLVIDVESAPWYEWALLEDIGEARARRIVEFVAQNRPLRSFDQLAEIPGIPSTWLEKAKPFLRLRMSSPGAGER